MLIFFIFSGAFFLFICIILTNEFCSTAKETFMEKKKTEIPAVKKQLKQAAHKKMPTKKTPSKIKKAERVLPHQTPLGAPKLPDAVPQILPSSPACSERILFQVQNYDTLPYCRTFRGHAFFFMLFIALMTILNAFILSDSEIFFSLTIVLPIVYWIYRSYRWTYLLAVIWWSLEKVTQIFYAEHDTTLISAVLWWGIGFWIFFRAFQVENIRCKKIKAAGEKCRKWPVIRDILLGVLIFFLTFAGLMIALEI